MGERLPLNVLFNVHLTDKLLAQIGLGNTPLDARSGFGTQPH